MPEDKEKTETKETKSKTSTMDITMINSTGMKFRCKGPCSDREFKAICKAIRRDPDQTIEVK